MARKRDRAFAGFFAILFLVTSSAVTISVILVLIQQHDQNDAATTPSSTTTPSSSTTKSPTKESTVKPTKLAGTQLSNFTPTASITQLQEEDTVAGTGATVKSGDTITVDYTGAVASTGTIFQSSLDSGQPVTFSLSQVIPGWTQGIPGMKVGGTRRLLIPANLAYGANPPSGSGIPANAALVFDVTLHKID
jgi:FKBP-type peptidyl-prolyl cis-trans isomerase